MATGKHLADAAIKAAKANHYLVGLVSASGTKLRVYPETAAEAQQIIYSLENSGKISQKIADIALHFINEAGGGSKAGL